MTPRVGMLATRGTGRRVWGGLKHGRDPTPFAGMNVLNSALLSGGSLIDLDGTWYVQLGLFAVAFFALRSLIFKPMVALFEAREEAIEGAKLEAKRLHGTAKEAAEKFDEQLREVRLRAGEERDRLREEGRHLEQSVLSKVNDEIEGQRHAANEKLKQEAARLRSEIKNDVPTLAQQIASKMLKREVN
ncbi:MAG: ATP synthase F0 subunit B [Polyangiales bacterium]